MKITVFTDRTFVEKGLRDAALSVTQEATTKVNVYDERWILNNFSFISTIGTGPSTNVIYAEDLMPYLSAIINRNEFHGLILSDDTLGHFEKTLVQAGKGEIYFRAKVLKYLMNEEISNQFQKLESLTAKEMQVFLLVLDGLGNREIAGKLEVSVRTVDKHKNNIISKTEIKNMTQLFRLILNYAPWKINRSVNSTQ